MLRQVQSGNAPDRRANETLSQVELKPVAGSRAAGEREFREGGAGGRRSDMEDLRFPIGKLNRRPGPNTPEERKQLIDAVAEVPERLKQAVTGLNGKQLDTPYREGGWTVRQVTHHLADSHINAYVRFKLALTEENPAVKPYAEAAWAELADSRITPIDVSLALVDNLHARWVVLLRSLKPEDWARKLTHPEDGVLSLDEMLRIYAWHGAHHVAHITGLRKRMQW